MDAARSRVGAVPKLAGNWPAANGRDRLAKAIAALALAADIVAAVIVAPVEHAYVGCVITGSPDTTDTCTGKQGWHQRMCRSVAVSTERRAMAWHVGPP